MSKNILVVGCGGLGCELIKLLYLEALENGDNITIVDNDTIDSTNLNRQFFFTLKDVNSPKPEIICKKIQKIFNEKFEQNLVKRIKKEKPTISYLYQKINDVKLSFYKNFDIVYNCLDNDETRSYVNKRCYINKIKLIDGGSAGWKGQSFINSKECFDCLPKKVDKVYPVCSIRQKPENFEHCAIWAKSVFEQNDLKSLKEEIEQHKNIEDCQNVENLDEIDNKNIEIDDLNKNIEINENSSEISDLIMENSFEESDKIEVENEDIFDKNFKIIEFFDDENDTLNSLGDKNSVIFQLACFKASRFNIPCMTFLNFTTFINKIIPSICTTNSIVASMMILSNKNNKNYYLSDRIISVDVNEKNKECLTCGIPNYVCKYFRENLITDFLDFFKSESILTEDMVYDLNSKEKLMILEGESVLVLKNGKKNRIYFEEHENNKIEVKRYI